MKSEFEKLLHQQHVEDLKFIGCYLLKFFGTCGACFFVIWFIKSVT